jgi:hypothetical protein
LGQTEPFVKWWKFAILVLLLAAGLSQSIDAVKKVQSLPVGFSYGVSWMRSAECARTTGKLLVLCENGPLRAIGEDNAGDDPGHALFLGIFAAVTGHKAVMSDVPILNAIFNGVGLLALAALLWWMELPLLSMTLLALGPILSRSYLYFSPHTAQLGATCLAMIAPLVILATSHQDKRKSAIAWLVAAIVCLALASLVRQAMGLMGLVAGVLSLFYRTLSVLRTPRNLVFSLTMLAALLAGYKAPSILLAARDFAYSLPSTGQMETHGIWHNLYIGLGAVDNPFGIIWNDENGFEHARAIDPTVRFTSKHYYDLLRGAYFDIVIHHPLAVAKVYIAKFWIAITQRPWIILFVTMIIAALLRFGLTDRQPWRTRIDAVLTVSTLFPCFFLAQSILFHFSEVYRFPMVISLILMIGVSIEMAIERSAKAALFSSWKLLRRSRTQGNSDPTRK